MDGAHWIQISKSDARKLNRLLRQEERNREYSRARYEYVHETELKPKKSLELIRPALAVHIATGQSCWLPQHDESWLACDESQYVLWFCVTDAQASELRRLIEKDSRRLEQARQRYAKKHPVRRPQTEAILMQLGA